MTGGQQFGTPLSLSALTGETVYTDLFSLTTSQMGTERPETILCLSYRRRQPDGGRAWVADDLATTILLATMAPS